MNLYALSIKKPEDNRAKSAGHTTKLPPIMACRNHTQSESDIKHLELKHSQGLRLVQGIRQELGFQ
jgi:hypothetical protein